MWSVCFAIDRVASCKPRDFSHGFCKEYHDYQLSNGYLVTHWPSCEIQPQELQFYHCLALVCCQSSNSQQNQHTARCRESVNESQMELMIFEVECRQRICDDCTFLEKGCQTMAVYTSKEYWAQDRTLRNPVMKRLLLRDPTVDADRLESIRQIRLKNHSKTLLDMPNMSCKRVRRMLWSNVSNAADRSSKVRMETRPSSALPRRRFVTSRRAVSVLWCARYADWKISERLLANRWPRSWCSTTFPSTLQRNGRFDTDL